MSRNHIDINDLLLEATAEIQAIIREVMDELLEPQIVSQVRQAWRKLPDDAKEKIKRQKPNEYAELMSMLGDSQ